jgi:leucyl/phenylalanyl-tRNA--protein transferase
MMNTIFPPPEQANEDGILAMGGELSVELLYTAYSQGVFPWPHEGCPLLWFCPWERGVLEFKNFHVPRSLRKFIKNQNWRYTWDQDFLSVIKECAKVERPGQRGTWINEEMINAYKKFHEAGFAHSLEVWDGNDLIGGIYGVFVKNVFSAESMFYKKSNASKWALWQLVNHLQKLGLEWIDVQMVTPITESFGALLISQKDFLFKLHENHKGGAINGISQTTPTS